MFTSIGMYQHPSRHPALQGSPGHRAQRGQGASSQPHSEARASPTGVEWRSLRHWGLTRLFLALRARVLPGR